MKTYWNYNFSSIKKQGGRLKVDTQNYLVTLHSVISGKDKLKMSGRHQWTVNLTTKCLKLKWNNQLRKLTKLSLKCTKNRSCGKDTPISQLHKHFKMNKKKSQYRSISAQEYVFITWKQPDPRLWRLIKVLAILTFKANLENLYINSFNEITKRTFSHLKGRLLFKFWVSHTPAPHLEISIQSWVLKCKYISTYSKFNFGWILGENIFILTQRTRWDKLLSIHITAILSWLLNILLNFTNSDFVLY